jgi:hypothetical protein
MFSFFAFAFKVCNKCKNDQNEDFYDDFKFADAGFQKCCKRKLKAKSNEKMCKKRNFLKFE